jgi:hypothetical protein
MDCISGGVLMDRKTWQEKLTDVKDLPRVEFVGYDSPMARRLGGGHMLIAAPLEYDAVMKQIPAGKLTTTEEIRAFLARQHQADFTCPLTCGIFVNIVAQASCERERAGAPTEDLTPYWRTLKKDPDGIDGQRALLEMEGHTIVQRGKRYFVKDFREKLQFLS